MGFAKAKVTVLIWIWVLAGINITSPANALDRQELADQIEVCETHLARYTFGFSELAGTATDEELQHRQVTQTNAVLTVGEYGADWQERKQYLRLQDSPGKDPRQVLHTAAGWVTLDPLPDGNAKWFARVSSKVPPMFEAHSVVVPALVGYPRFGDLSLADAIRNAADLKVVPTVVEGGQQALCVTLLLRPKKAMNIEGQTIIGQGCDLYRMWLLPDRGMLPIRMDTLSVNGPAFNKSINETQSVSLASIEADSSVATSVRWQEDIREVAPGTWFPHKVTFYTVVKTIKNRARQLVVEHAKIGEEATVPDKLVMPAGTNVHDEIKNLRYVVGMAAADVDKGVMNAVSQVKEIERGRLSVTSLPGNRSAATRATSGDVAGHGGMGGTMFGVQTTVMLTTAVPVALAVLIVVLILVWWRKRHGSEHTPVV